MRRKQIDSKTEEHEDKNLDEILERTLKSHNAREAAEYDGVLGVLPSWIPDNFHQTFRSTRTRLLDAGYDPKQIRIFIAAHIRTYRAAIAIPTDAISRYPFVLPPAVRNDVALLAHIWRGVRLGKAKGLAFLTDPAHAQLVMKGEDYGAHMRRIAIKPRRTWRLKKNGPTESDEPIKHIIARLAKGDQPVRDLWYQLLMALDNDHLDPIDIPHSTDRKKDQLKYTHGRIKRTISYHRFENLISFYRNEK